MQLDRPVPRHEDLADQDRSSADLSAAFDRLEQRTGEILHDAVNRLTVGLLISMASMMVIFLVLLSIP